MKECKWLLYPICGNKTRDKIREDTVLENFPLFCPECKQETLISIRKFNMSVIKEPDAQPHSYVYARLKLIQSGIFAFIELHCRSPPSPFRFQQTPKNRKDGKTMKKINLKDYYPYYKQDNLVEVSDELLAIFQESVRTKAAYERKKYRYKAHYSLDRNDGIEHDILFVSLSPDEIYERKLTSQQLHASIASLPDKQEKQIYAHYFMGMSKTSIAKAEGVSEKAVRIGIERGKDGTYKEIYYYVCSKARTARGKSCDYKAMLKKTNIEPLVIEAIRELIKNQDFAAEIKSRIGKEIDTSTLNRELKNYENKLREVELNKTRLENEIDSLPEDTRFRERKFHDMTLRLDGLYYTIVELEENIDDVKLRRKAVEQDAITLENIYTLLANFDKVYDKINDEEKKSLISSLIKEIEIFLCDNSELPLKSILFNFPVYKDGGDVCGFLWDKSTHVSTWVGLCHLLYFTFYFLYSPLRPVIYLLTGLTSVYLKGVIMMPK